MVKLTKLYRKAAKHVLRYLRGTTQFGLWSMCTKGVKLPGFTYADWTANWERSPSDRRSTSGAIFSVRSVAISWYNRKQRSIALNSAEAEYMVASQATCEVIWMRKILIGLFGQMMDPTVIYCDNQSCIKLSKNLVFHNRSKHINICYHHLRDCVVKRIMKLQYVSTKE